LRRTWRALRQTISWAVITLCLSSPNESGTVTPEAEPFVVASFCRRGVALSNPSAEAVELHTLLDIEVFSRAISSSSSG